MASILGAIAAMFVVTVYLLLTFATGVYAGIYITQNYDVPRVDEPSKIWEKVKAWADSHKKQD